MIHSYQLNGYNIVLDVYSGSVHAVDDLAYDVINLYETCSREEIVSRMLAKYRDRPEVTAEEIGAVLESVEDLKARGVWIYTADMDGSPWCQTDFTGPAALVIGSEGSGVSRLVKERSDFVVSLPIKGQVNSLNASVAAGVLCYEVARQRSGLQAFEPKRREM